MDFSINGVALPVYYKDGKLLVSQNMKIWGTSFSSKNIRGEDVLMYIMPWTERSTMAVVAYEPSNPSGIHIGYPVIPDDILYAKGKKGPTGISLAYEALSDAFGTDNLEFQIYNAKITVDV